MSPALELRNWLTRKAEGVQAHISKNVSSYIRHDIIEGFNIHQKQFLEPLIVKLVIDSKKEQVANALANFPQLINLFNASENNLGNLLNGDSDQFEVTVLRLLKQIPGLENLVVTDVVNYPENMKVIQELLNGNPAQLLLNKDMQSDLTYPLTKYLQGDFIKYLSAFITYPQVKRVEQILAKKNNAQQFVQHCLAQIFNGDLELDPEHIFTELKNYFNIKELSLINEEMDELQVGISALEKEIKDNLIQSLDEEHIQQLMSILREQLLPVLVNVFPLQHRSELLNTASKSSKLKRLIQVHGKEILALMEHKKEELPVFIFSKLSRNSLPDLIDIPQHAKDAELLFKDKFAEILQAGLIGLSLRKLTAFSSWNLNPKYMHDAAIANFLQSDECLDAISLMLPHNQWLQLKADVSQNYSGLITIARILIDKAAAGDSLELKPAQILELLNQHLETEYTSPEQTLVQASEALREITKEATANPMAMLNTEIQDKFAQLATAHLLPLLACFIKDNDKKMQFLNLKRDNERVYQFIVANSEVLSTFNGQSEESMRLLGFNLVNQLMPDDSKLVLDDMIHPQSNATNLAPIIKKEVQKITLITFFNSKTFKDLMKDYLNPQDFTLLMNYLSVPDQQSVLADKMISRGVESLDREAILSLVKSTDPTLASISPMDEGFNSIKDYLVEMSSEMTEAFDTYKISQLMSSSIIPVLFHEQFIKIIDEVLGFLNEQDLTVLFEAMDNPHPAEEAKQLLEFIHLIRVQDQEALTQKFISLPEGVNGLSLDVLPAKKMLDNIKDLIEEVLDCHCHYHQQDRKGLQYGNVSPKLISKVSPELKDIRIASDYSFFSGFSRKIFYIQGINEGVEAAGQISADSNKHVVAILQRVKSHILRPLWWSTNVSNFSHGFVKHSRDVVDGIISGYYGALNGVKSALNWICGRNVFTVSAKNSESEDFNNTAFDFALEINELEAMTPAQVEKTDCRMDVVKNLEEFIAQRPSRAGFFPASTDADLSTLSEERNAGYGL